MRTRSNRSANLTAVILLALALWPLACSDSVVGGPRVDGAVVTFAFSGSTDTMRVHVRKASTIEAARAYIQTQTGPKFPIGTIVRGAGADPKYPFHYLPDEVSLAEVAMELCDGRPMKTEAAVEQFFTGSTGRSNAPTATYCPWGAYPVAVRDSVR